MVKAKKIRTRALQALKQSRIIGDGVEFKLGTLADLRLSLNLTTQHQTSTALQSVVLIVLWHTVYFRDYSVNIGPRSAAPYTGHCFHTACILTACLYRYSLIVRCHKFLDVV